VGAQNAQNGAASIVTVIEPKSMQNKADTDRQVLGECTT
jgi:hypothetical protein